MSAQTFKTKKDVLNLPAPTDKPAVDVRHATQAGFYVRIMKENAVGQVRRSWVCRYPKRVPDGLGGYKEQDRKDVIGLVEKLEPADVVMTLEEALAKVLDMRRSLREQRVAGGKTPRLTVAGAWAYYDIEKALNRETSRGKAQHHYEHCLAYLGDKFLDELDYPFWSRYLADIRSGKLVIGTTTDESGNPVPITRGPYANATLTGIINTAISLYKIAHRYRGLQGLAPGENPAEQVKELIGTPNKRKGMIPLNKLGAAWLAADQVVSPWWRDLFRVVLLTGLRRSLLYSMRFDEIDFKEGTLYIHPEKPGTKQRGHDFGEEVELIKIPLARATLEILSARRKYAPDRDGPVWFAPKTGRGARGNNTILSDQRKAWELITNAAGTKEATPHDCRRTFATTGSVAIKGNLLGVALLLMHSASTLAKAAGLPDITIQYINTQEAQSLMREAAEAIAAYIENLARLEAQGAATDTPTPDLPLDLELAVGKE